MYVTLSDNGQVINKKDYKIPDGKEKAKEYAIKTTRDKDIKLISLWFTDILGFLKSFSITPRELETALVDGGGFDGSSIEALLDLMRVTCWPAPTPPPSKSYPGVHQSIL